MDGQHFSFNLPGHDWKVHAQLSDLDKMIRIWTVSFEERLYKQLDDALSPSAPEYKKHHDNVQSVAKLYAQDIGLRHVYELLQEGKEVVLSKSIDELFDVLGQSWLRLSQFAEALAAFITSVKISERKGSWWLQRLCARCNHLAYVHMILSNQQEQLQASMRSVAFAFAVAWKDPSLIDNLANHLLLVFSLYNLAIQFLNYNCDISIIKDFEKDLPQAWEHELAKRRLTLEETQGTYTEEDLCFAMTDFLIHNNRDAFKSMLALLKSVSFESLLTPDPNLASRECQNLIKVCGVGTLIMTSSVENPKKPQPLLIFAMELLEVATIEPPPNMEGLLMSPTQQLLPDEEGLVFMSRELRLLLAINQESTPNMASNSKATTRREGTPTPVLDGWTSKYEEFNDIIKQLQSKKWKLTDPCESEKFRDLGRNLGEWAISSSIITEAPFEDISQALLILWRILKELHVHFQNHTARSMLQNIVLPLTNQPDLRLQEICIVILLEYAQICHEISYHEETVICCTKVLHLTERHQMNREKLDAHSMLVSTYMNLVNFAQAEEELHNAQNILTHDLELSKDNSICAMIEGLEGRLELCKAEACGLNMPQAVSHSVTAVNKLETSLHLLELELSSSNDIRPHLEAWVRTSLQLSNALQAILKFPDAHDVCDTAFKVAKESKFFSTAAEAARQCGHLAQMMGNFKSAERYFREGLQELEKHGDVEETLAGNLRGGLGTSLQSQGEFRLAEDELRRAVNLLSQGLTKSTLTSQFHIGTFENLKGTYYNLQSCLYAKYMQATGNQQGIIATEALVAAEQGRCRDLTMHLQRLLKSSVHAEDGKVSADDTVDMMDWKKFDTDVDAWEHLRKCMTLCTDALKEQNGEVQRVTFVEYTLLRDQILIWVLHNDGTQEPSTVEITSTLPTMYCVDVREEFKNMVTDVHREVWEDFQWIHGPEESESQYNTFSKPLQEIEAVLLFEGQIEKLRNNPKPKTQKLNELYKLLISPFAHELDVGEPVIFIPHEELSFIPFAALKPKGGKHLIENHPIGIASSLRTLGWATKQYKTLKARCTISGKTPMLLVGDPFPLPIQEKLDPLDDAIKEVNRIATMLPDDSTAILLQEHATLENVISAMKTTAWCHIASHGKVSPEYPQGVLFMSCTNEVSPKIDTGTSFSEELEQQRSSGLLTTETICNNVRCMTAHAAVISACKIGLGKKTGEGLLGMSRAFMQAGVPLVLAPLRAVDSRLGSAFMQHLYEKLVAGENVMFALRNTMVDVLQKRVKVDLTAAEKENNEVVKWQLWDWAAWMAVGFPGVCLPLSVTTPNLDDLRITEAAESEASCSY